MEDVVQILKTAIEELEHMLTSKTVIGEPITVNDTTIIPLVSIGFGFGAGGGSGKSPKDNKAEGTGGGTGGGGGIKPVAVVIINKDGVRVEPIKSGAASVVEKIADAIGKARARRGEEKEKTE